MGSRGRFWIACQFLQRDSSPVISVRKENQFSSTKYKQKARNFLEKFVINLLLDHLCSLFTKNSYCCNFVVALFWFCWSTLDRVNSASTVPSLPICLVQILKIPFLPNICHWFALFNLFRTSIWDLSGEVSSRNWPSSLLLIYPNGLPNDWQFLLQR